MKTISKVPIAHEDIAIGAGKILQERAGESVEVRQVELDWIFRTQDEIRGLNVAAYSRAQLHQRGATYDYWFDETSVLADDDRNVLRPVAIGEGSTGRWRRVYRASDGASIPLAGSEPDAPVTGTITFYDTAPAMHIGPSPREDEFAISAARAGMSISIVTRTEDNAIERFLFTPDGQFFIPTHQAGDGEGWQIGAATSLAGPNTLIFAAVDTAGNVLARPATIVVGPTSGFLFHTDGHANAPRGTEATDPDEALTTKGYVDAAVAALAQQIAAL